MAKRYDVIVIGARCAGSPLAMLLARQGHRVLLADRSSFPSDTISTHVVQPLAVAALARWGLLERLVATGCPPIHTYTFDFGPFVIAGAPGTNAAPLAYCPRRTILDKLLVDAAAEGGAEVRERVTVDQLILEDDRVIGIKARSQDGDAFIEHADVVVDADGRHSLVAETVKPEHYNERAPFIAGYYAYWSSLPMDGRFETYIRQDCGFAAAPTHDGLTLVVAGWPFADFQAGKKDIEGTYLNILAQAPDFAKRLQSAKRVSRFAGTGVPNYFRKPYGPGWALVGDAGYLKDFITAQGINDAFRDAERCAMAFNEYLDGSCSYDHAMRAYQRERDEHVRPMYEFTCQLASLKPPPRDMQRLFAAIAGNQAAMDGFAQMNAGTISPAAYLAPENVAKIMSGHSRST
jgi:2-polyprenyl-6-methoxyphenol hydroxylase-like FAD-dependent oxidoreductase